MITFVRMLRHALYVPFEFVAWLTCLIDEPLRSYIVNSTRESDD
jgi:hypothetical protein